VDETVDVLERYRSDLKLSVSDLWWRYFALGGMRTEFEIEGILFSALVATAQDRDLIAVALNERVSELGGDHPIPYSTDA